LAAIRLPANGWTPRDYQLPAWEALEGGVKRALLVWARRHGKDDVCLHYAATQTQERVGTYWHMLPQAAQARKAIWDAVNPHTGRRRIDEVFPRELRATTREQDMLIRFKSGSSWQVLGSDNYDNFVGSPPVGVVFSEWALCDPRAWSYVRPILLENDGWALFNSTPRGQNHLHEMYTAYEDDPSWFVQRLRADQSGLFTEKQLESERSEYIKESGADVGDALFRQEYMCSFEAPVVGAYYARLLEEAEGDGRISNVPFDPAVPVYTAWDLGIGDSTAIWFAQVLGREVRLIDYYEASGVGLDHYVAQLREGRRARYAYAEHWLPHDADHKELSTGRSRIETLRSLGLEARVLPVARVEDGINAVRMLLPRVWIDKERCAEGIKALKHYRSEWDEKRKVLRPRPLHDWSSHGADAMRYFAQAYRDTWGNPRKTYAEDLALPDMGAV